MYHRGRPTSREMTVEMLMVVVACFQREASTSSRKRRKRTKRGTSRRRRRERMREKGGERQREKEKAKKDKSERRRRESRMKEGGTSERDAKDGAFDLRNGSLNRMYWVIELCGGMTSQDFLNKLLIIPPLTADCRHNREFANRTVLLREHRGDVLSRYYLSKKIMYEISSRC